MKKQLIVELTNMGYDVKDKNTSIPMGKILVLANKLNTSGFEIIKLLGEM